MAVSLLGCGSSSPTNNPDMMRAHDLAMETHEDLSMPIKMDLSVPPRDMSPPMLTGLPTGCASGVTAVTLYSNVVSTNCALAGCHGDSGGYVHWHAGNAAELIQAMVGVQADQTGGMDRVKANDLNNSYVLYKLMNEQDRAAQIGSAGAQMPDGNPMLSSADICMFISWIQGGAM
jgi:hypothetical protein